MAFDFPASPTSGDTYSPPGGPTFAWDGVAWKANVQGVPTTVYFSDTPPPSPALGQLWWNSSTGNLAIWYQDADSAQWVQVSGSVAPVGTAQTRNRIVNGAMQISQELGATGTTANAYFADQWSVGRVSSSTVTVSQFPATPGDPPSALCVASPVETAAAAAEYVVIQQVIEGINTVDFRLGLPNSKQFIVAFDVWMYVAGTYWVSIANASSSHSFLASYTVGAGELSQWVRKSVIIPAGAINAGTWAVDNTAGLILRFCFHCGTNYTGVAGFQAGNKLAGPGQALGLSNVDGVYLTNVGLYLDPQRTGVAPPWVTPDEAEELRACQRYWEKGVSNYDGTSAVNGSVHSQMILYKVDKRVPAALAETGTAVNGFPNSFGSYSPTLVSSVRLYRTTNVAAPSTAAWACNWFASARM